MIDGLNQEMFCKIDLKPRYLQKRTKGWWPMYAKDENDELMLQGKVKLMKGKNRKFETTIHCVASRNQVCSVQKTTLKRWSDTFFVNASNGFSLFVQ